jgi:hypothetical protein
MKKFIFLAILCIFALKYAKAEYLNEYNQNPYCADGFFYTVVGSDFMLSYQYSSSKEWRSFIVHSLEAAKITPGYSYQDGNCVNNYGGGNTDVFNSFMMSLVGILVGFVMLASMIYISIRVRK